MQDYENVYKYTDLSSTEQAPVGPKSKKVPKIKITASEKDQRRKRGHTPEMRNSSTPTKQLPATFSQTPSATPSNTRFARFRSWFSFRRPSPQQNSGKESGHDPTYGFGSRCTSQTYFKTANVDSSIPNDVDFKMAIAGMLGADHCTSIESVPSTINGTNNTNLTTPDAKDILYPLRTSLDGASSGKKRKQESVNSTYESNGTNYLSTKRVKFDDKEDVASESFFERRERIHAQQYQQQENSVPYFKPHVNDRMSLKDRIVDFFTNLI